MSELLITTGYYVGLLFIIAIAISLLYFIYEKMQGSRWIKGFVALSTIQSIRLKPELKNKFFHLFNTIRSGMSRLIHNLLIEIRTNYTVSRTFEKSVEKEIQNVLKTIPFNFNKPISFFSDKEGTNI